MNLAKLSCLAALAAALVSAPSLVQAQDATTNAPAAAKPAAKPAKAHPLPYHGKITAVDTNALTFTLDTLTLVMTSETKITKEGKPGVFADITVGENVSGSYKKDDAGKLNATSVRIRAPKKADAPAPQ